MRSKAYQCAQVIPDLGNVRVKADGAGVGIEGVPVLVDLVVQNTNGAPEGGVPAITVDGLLVGLVRLGVLLLRHVAAAEQVPALGVLLVGANRLLEVLDCALLHIIGITLLMVEPTQLLENLGVVGGVLKDAVVCVLGSVKLKLVSVNRVMAGCDAVRKR